MYKNVFNELKGKEKLRLKQYETVFKNKTGLNYKEFIIDQYVNKDKSRHEMTEILGIDYIVLSKQLEEYRILKKKDTSKSEIMNKTPTQIEEETGRPLIDIYNELTVQGYSLTEIAMKLNMAHVSSLSAYLKRYRRREERKGLNKEELLFNGELVKKKLKVIRKIFIEKLGIEYKEWLRQKYLVEGLSPYDISLITGIKEDTQIYHLRYFGIKKTKEQAVLNALEHGAFKPHETIKKARKTMQKKTHSGNGSNAQNLFIKLLKHYLNKFTIELEGIEIITGYNEYSVLHSYEIDIPIVAFYNDRVYKIAIEYDGNVWHEENENDNLKDKLMIEKGWKIIRIEGNNKTSVDMKMVDNDTKELATKIIKYIKNN